ncbi:MAG: hypothetical protein AB2A00_35270 [Myxococcota bacterium]
MRGTKHRRETSYLGNIILGTATLLDALAAELKRSKHRTNPADDDLVIQCLRSMRTTRGLLAKLLALEKGDADRSKGTRARVRTASPHRRGR